MAISGYSYGKVICENINIDRYVSIMFKIPSVMPGDK